MEPNTNNMVMPVAPMGYGYGMPFGGMGGLGGLNGFGGEGWWIILLFLVLGRGAFGGYGAGGYGMGGAPVIINNSDDDNNRGGAVQRGFDQAAIMGGINGVQSAVTTGFGNVQTSLCSGFAGVNATVNGAQNAISHQLYANEIANLNRSFAEQTANAQGFNGVQAQLAQNNYNQAAGTADIKYTLATEACNTRATDTANTQAILTEIRNGIQSLKDDAYQRELDAERRENANLRTQISMKDLAASQTAQNAFIAQTVNEAIDANYARFKDCPVGTTPVYGNTPIFQCPQAVNANNCGCGSCSGFVA